MNAPIVFLDKDGTLIDDVPYNVDPNLIRLRPGAGEALRSLHEQGWRIVVVSNQSGVARGLFPVSALAAVEARLRELLSEYAVPLAACEFCPHHPDGIDDRYSFPCECRKPAPGLLLKAAKSLQCDLQRSWMIGNELSDVEAGHRAGCRTIMLSHQEPNCSAPTTECVPTALAADLPAAARHILSEARSAHLA